MSTTEINNAYPIRSEMPTDLYLMDATRRMEEDLAPDDDVVMRLAKRNERGSSKLNIKKIFEIGIPATAAALVLAVGAVEVINDATEVSPINPNAVVHPYTVGSTPQDRMVSEIASDMHQFAPNQNYNDELPIINSYLTPAEIKAGEVSAGRVIEFRINGKVGKIMYPALGNSANG